MISIIIPTKDRVKIYENTIQAAIRASRNIESEIIVVDDDSDIKPKTFDAKVKLIDNCGNGVASARNTGALAATGQILLFIDNDILITEESLIHITSLHKELHNVCINPNWEYPANLQQQVKSSPLGRSATSWLRGTRCTSERVSATRSAGRAQPGTGHPRRS
jgi:glycosyltransferase involved in cell wall biosynthesis